MPVLFNRDSSGDKHPCPGTGFFIAGGRGPWAGSNSSLPCDCGVKDPLGAVVADLGREARPIKSLIYTRCSPGI